MANVKQIKQKTTGTLLNIEDTQARSDIASEITNRTNADNELQEKINTNKNDISKLKSDLADLDDKTDVGTNKTQIEITLGKKGSVIWNNGDYSATSGSSTYCTEPFSVDRLKKIYISGRFYNHVIGAFYGETSQTSNAVGVIQDVESDSDRTLTDYEVEVPSGAKYCRICTYVYNNASAKYPEGIKIKDYIYSECDRTYNDSISYSKLKGKKVVWFGTSIPAGGVSGNYPKILADRLGFTVYNEAIGSSACRAGCHSKITDSDPLGWIGTAFQNIAYSLSGSLEEKEEIITNYSKYGWDATLNDIDKEYIRNCSYERKLDKYLSGGSVGRVDLYVFDHGFNDALFHNETIDELETIPTDKYDRTYFIGAMNFLINRILTDNPKAKIVFIQHYQTDWSASSHVVPAQKLLAQYWNFPSLEVWKDIGWTEKTIKSKGSWVNGLWVDNSLSTERDYSIKNIWMADNLHPHSDLSGKALNHYADILEPFFKDLSLNN